MGSPAGGGRGRGGAAPAAARPGRRAGDVGRPRGGL